MQPHPDRGELKLYLRGYAPAPIANVIKQHLMVCDQCVGDALVEYDHLDRTRSTVPTSSDNRETEVTGLIPAANATIVINGPKPRLRYAWAALLPIATAIGLIWNVSGRAEKSQLWANIPTAPVVDQSQFARPVPPALPLAVTPQQTVKADAEVPRTWVPIRRQLENDATQPTAHKTPVARFYVVSAKSSASQPLLLQPVEVHPPAVQTAALHSSAALTLVARTPSIAPPPQPRGIKKVFSVLAAPFRKS